MKKILIIEDDLFLQGLEAGKLEKSGYAVITAKSGAEALTKIFEPGVDLVLLDMVLPDHDGFEILEKLQSDDRTKKIPVLVFSNLSEEKDVDRAKLLGATDFMVKSNFTLDELAMHIKEILK